MAKAEWGTKRTCQTCGSRFYDLGRTPIVCPNCGAVFDLEVLTRTRRARPASRAVAAPVVEDDQAGRAAPNEAEADLEEAEEAADEEEATEEAAAEEEDDDEDEALIEDASELGEDDDVEDVIDGEIDEEDQR